MPGCDVIIPAYNNAAVLPLTLQALGEQIVPPGWRIRILISDDGSTDQTIQIIHDWHSRLVWPVEVMQGTHTGPAGARNRALTQAAADIIFFLGADIILRPSALAAHLHFHEQFPAAEAAALGMIRWDPRLLPTPLMEWMIHGGPQNNFDALLGESVVAGKYLYGSHLSVKRSLLGGEKFSERFGTYGWEDTELGQRLEDKGLQLHPLPQAVGLHHHYYSIPATAYRQRLVGQGILILRPNDRRWHWLYWIFSWLGGAVILGWTLSFSARHFSTPWLFSIFTGVYFWQGVHDFSVDK